MRWTSSPLRASKPSTPPVARLATHTGRRRPAKLVPPRRRRTAARAAGARLRVQPGDPLLVDAQDPDGAARDEHAAGPLADAAHGATADLRLGDGVAAVAGAPPAPSPARRRAARRRAAAASRRRRRRRAAASAATAGRGRTRRARVTGRSRVTTVAGAGRPAAAARAARPTSPADGCRRSGSFAIARSTTASSPAGSPGLTADGTGAGSCRCAHSFASSVGRSNGTRPVSMK